MEERSEAYWKLADRARCLSCALVFKLKQHDERHACFVKGFSSFIAGNIYFVTDEHSDDNSQSMLSRAKPCIIKEIDVTDCKTYDEMLVKIDLSLDA